MRERVVLFVAILLSASLICGARFFTAQSTTYVYPDAFPGQRLQQAIWNDTVKDGDRIAVRQGTYHEHLDVNKSITVEGFDRNTVILDGDWNGTVIFINADNVNIFEFTVEHGGVTGHGVAFNDTVSNCNVSSNIIMNNLLYGIEVSGSGQALRDNDIKNNTYNFGVSGRHDIDASNKVDGKPVCYLKDQQDKEVPLDIHYTPGYVALVNCRNITVRNIPLLTKNAQGVQVEESTNITLQNLDLRDNDIGVSFWSTSGSTIENVTIRGYDRLGYGVELEGSSNNVVFNNTVDNLSVGIDISTTRYPYLLPSNYNIICGNLLEDSYSGIEVMNSTGNKIYHNNFIGNSVQATSMETGNYWDNGAEGNYWCDYFGTGDMNGDGINEGQYNRAMLHERDRFPLNETWSPVRIIDVTWFANVTKKYYDITILSDHVVACYRDGFKPISWTERKGAVTFNITAGIDGYCNVTMPRDRLDYPFDLFVDGNLTKPENWNLTATHCWLYFTYTSGTHHIKIISYRTGWIFGDLDGNGKVDMKDIGYVCRNYGIQVKEAQDP